MNTTEEIRMRSNSTHHDTKSCKPENPSGKKQKKKKLKHPSLASLKKKHHEKTWIRRQLWWPTRPSNQDAQAGTHKPKQPRPMTHGRVESLEVRTDDFGLSNWARGGMSLLIQIILLVFFFFCPFSQVWPGQYMGCCGGRERGRGRKERLRGGQSVWSKIVMPKVYIHPLLMIHQPLVCCYGDWFGKNEFLKQVLLCPNYLCFSLTHTPWIFFSSTELMDGDPNH